MLFNPYDLLPPMGWLVLSILTTAAWSLLVRVLNKDEKDYLASLALTEGATVAFLLLLILTFGFDFATEGKPPIGEIPQLNWILMALAGVFYAVFIYFTFKGSQTVEGSIRPILGQTEIIWGMLLAFLFLSEVITGQKIFAGLLILAGSVICIYRPGGKFKLAGVGLILFAALFVASGHVIDRVNSQLFPPLIYAIPLFIIPTIIFFAMMGKKAFERTGKVFEKRPWVSLLLSAFAAVSHVFLLLSLAKIEASVVIPLFNTFVIVAALGGIIFLKERKGWVQKIVGALLAFIGAAIIS
ncbi:MAG: DMT family transporter [Candidatus Micrarchaeota archaeon]